MKKMRTALTGRISGPAIFAAVFFRAAAAIISVLILILAFLFTIPRLSGVEPYIVRSSSMVPAIQTGAVAFIDTTLQPENAGQIIAFRIMGENDEVILHRIVGIKGDGWITKGDANTQEDPDPVYPEAVVGTYLFSVPRAGFILAGMQGERMMITAGVVIVLNVLSELAEMLINN